MYYLEFEERVEVKKIAEKYCRSKKIYEKNK